MVTSTIIDYTYDPLYRLTAADYSTGEYFHYTYDAVGNRLTQETHEEANTYLYDAANRLIEVDGLPYVWDAKGNLINDGTSIYTYDHANRLSGVVQGADTYSFAYNGLGDRLQQTVNGVATSYTLDLNVGLTQVLEDGANTYLYGFNRIGELSEAGWAYYQGEALGSVRQLTDLTGNITLAQSYEPFGSILYNTGTTITSYGYTGEWMDTTGLLYLRARYLSTDNGRFITRDTWRGNKYQPLTLNKWNYANSNPIYWVDPSGQQGEVPGVGGIVECFGIALLIPDPIPITEGICALIAVGVVSSIAMPYIIRSAQDIVDLIKPRVGNPVDTCEDINIDWLEDTYITEKAPEPKPKSTPVPQYIDVIPKPKKTPRPGMVFQFEEPPSGSMEFKNGPGEKDIDGISVALSHKCSSPATCLSAMFRRPPLVTDYYREAEMPILLSFGFVVTPNGGEPIPNRPQEIYPGPHASVTHPDQSYRLNGGPKWSTGLKNLFRSAFSVPRLVVSSP